MGVTCAAAACEGMGEIIPEMTLEGGGDEAASKKLMVNAILAYCSMNSGADSYQKYSESDAVERWGRIHRQVFCTTVEFFPQGMTMISLFTCFRSALMAGVALAVGMSAAQAMGSYNTQSGVLSLPVVDVPDSGAFSAQLLVTGSDTTLRLGSVFQMTQFQPTTDKADVPASYRFSDETVVLPALAVTRDGRVSYFDVTLHNVSGAAAKRFVVEGLQPTKLGRSDSIDRLGNDTGVATEQGRNDSCIIGDVRLTANGSVSPGLIAKGQLLQISQYASLFSLIGTRFGGDGVRNFALPNLQAAAPNGLTYYICIDGRFPTRL